MTWELSDDGRSVSDALNKWKKGLGLVLCEIQVLADRAELHYHMKMFQVKFSKT